MTADRPGPNFSTTGALDNPSSSTSPSSNIPSPDLSRRIQSQGQTQSQTSSQTQSQSQIQPLHHQVHQHPIPRRALSNSCTLASPSLSNPAASRKSRCAEPGTSEIHAQRTNFSIPPHSPNALTSPRSLLPRARRESGTSATSEAWSEDSSLAVDSQHPHPEDLHSLRSRLAANNENAVHSTLPESSSASRISASEYQNRRLSGTSIYSLASARGVIGPASAHGSDLGTPPRSVPSLPPTGKGLMPSHSETGLSNVTVTTSSTAPPGQASTGQHHLAPRDPHSQPLDLIKRTQRADTMQNSTANHRSQPDRSRSRAKRRFSGSTATSSHSPSSDRAPHHREREEGRYFCRNVLFGSNGLTSYSETCAMGCHWCLRPGCKSSKQTQSKHLEPIDL